MWYDLVDPAFSSSLFRHLGNCRESLEKNFQFFLISTKLLREGKIQPRFFQFFLISTRNTTYNGHQLYSLSVLPYFDYSVQVLHYNFFTFSSSLFRRTYCRNSQLIYVFQFFLISTKLLLQELWYTVTFSSSLFRLCLSQIEKRERKLSVLPYFDTE